MHHTSTGLRTLTVVRQDVSLGAGRDLEFGLELLGRAKGGGIGPTLRLYRPAPTVAFGQRDTRLPGFDAAAQACRDHGFEPLVRRAGGRAAAYHQGTLVVDHIEPDTDAVAGSKTRFGHFGELFARALRSVGVQAAVGEIPTDSYAALGLDWDPATAGAANDLVPGLDVATVEQALLDTYAGHATLETASFSSLGA